MEEVTESLCLLSAEWRMMVEARGVGGASAGERGGSIMLAVAGVARLLGSGDEASLPGLSGMGGGTGS